jgi:hypothetical protein
MMEYADPQLMSNSSPISVTVFRLFCRTRGLSRSTLFAVRESVGRPEWPSSLTLVLPLSKLSTHWYTFLCVIELSPYFAKSLL